MAASIGIFAWSGEPQLLPLALLFPALWASAPSRMGAVMVSAAYFLSASRGLPQGVANFYGPGFEAGIALWIVAAIVFVIIHAVLWTSRPGWARAVRYTVAAILMSVPPFGIVGWAHPITAAGIVFPGWSWWGLGAAAIGLLVLTTRFWPIAILTFGGLWIVSAATWTVPNLPQGWVGVDTQFGGARDEYAGYSQHLETIAIVKSAAIEGSAVVLLPEGAAGIWTPTTERLWLAALADTNVIVIAGAVIVTAEGYDNVMLEVSGAGARVLYRQRMPVPVSMWQPWQAITGEGGGTQAHFFDNPVVDFAGQRIAPLICYEQLLIWPILQSAFYSPDVIFATGNGWWTAETSIVAIQQASATAWVRLFGIPAIAAFNV